VAQVPKDTYSDFPVKAILVIIPLLTILIYIPALHNDFVNWDDQKYIYENTNIWKLNKQSLQWMFTAYHSSNWHPLTWLSHGIDYAIWGLDPVGHHLTSIVLHGLNTFLVVLLITRDGSVIRGASVACRVGGMGIGAEGCAVCVFLFAECTVLCQVCINASEGGCCSLQVVW
jgi:hypothetical protein